MTPREARKSRGLEQGWVAQQMGISQAYLSRLESGERNWVGDLATRFALAIGLSRSLISFAPSDTANVPERNVDRGGASKYSATCTATTGR